MFKSRSVYDLDQTLSKLESSITEYDYKNPYMVGYVGVVNKADKKFWVVNHTNVVFTGLGFGYNSLRRFEGKVYYSYGQAIIEGEFKLRPSAKIMVGFQILVLIFMNILAAWMGLDFVEMLKLIGYSCLIVLFFAFIMYMRLRETSKVENEIIEFIEGLIL